MGERFVAHGGRNDDLLRQFGVRYEDVIDFSSNINPFGPDLRIVSAVAAHDFSSYPDPDATRLRERIAAHHRVERKNVIVGNGSTELMSLTTQALLHRDDTVLIAGPTFGEYRRVCEQQRTSVREIRARESGHFAFPVDEFEAALRTDSPRLCFLCRPNNPTGVTVEESVVVSWIDRFPETIFVVDEAYQPFAPQVSSLVELAPTRPNLVVLRSLTKSHALAGLRLGELVASSQLVADIELFKCPWNVNSAAQAAGHAIFEQDITMKESLHALAESQRELIEGLVARGFEVQAGVSAYCLLRVASSRELFETLLRRGLLVRPCESFGLPEHLRISTRRAEDHTRLWEGIRS